MYLWCGGVGSRREIYRLDPGLAPSLPPRLLNTASPGPDIDPEGGAEGRVGGVGELGMGWGSQIGWEWWISVLKEVEDNGFSWEWRCYDDDGST